MPTTNEVQDLYEAAVRLRDFIEMQPASTPVLWVGDLATKVVDMPHYKSSVRAINVFEHLFNSEATNAG